MSDDEREWTHEVTRRLLDAQVRLGRLERQAHNRAVSSLLAPAILLALAAAWALL